MAEHRAEATAEQTQSTEQNTSQSTSQNTQNTQQNESHNTCGLLCVLLAHTCSFTETFLMLTALAILTSSLRHILRLQSSAWEDEHLERVAETGSRALMVVMSHTAN